MSKPTFPYEAKWNQRSPGTWTCVMYYAMNKPSLLITNAKVTEKSCRGLKMECRDSKAQRCYTQQLAHSSWFRVAKLLVVTSVKWDQVESVYGTVTVPDLILIHLHKQLIPSILLLLANFHCRIKLRFSDRHHGKIPGLRNEHRSCPPKHVSSVFQNFINLYTCIYSLVDL